MISRERGKQDSEAVRGLGRRRRPDTASAPSNAALEDVIALPRRLRMPYLRAAALDVVPTARAQRWDPAELLRVLLGGEITGSDQTALRPPSRREIPGRQDLRGPGRAALLRPYRDPTGIALVGVEGRSFQALFSVDLSESASDAERLDFDPRRDRRRRQGNPPLPRPSQAGHRTSRPWLLVSSRHAGRPFEAVTR